MKSTKIIGLLSILALCQPTHLLLAAPVPKQVNKVDPIVEINFSDLTMVDFVKMVSKISGKNILLNGVDLQGKVDFITEKPIKKSQLFDLLISVLETKGFTIVFTPQGFYKIVPSAEATKHNLPVNQNGNIPQMMTRIIKLSTIKAADAVAAVKPLLSKSGNILASAETNTLVISDYKTNIDTSVKILHSLDGDNQRKIKFFQLTNARCNIIYENVQKIAASIFNQALPSEKVDILKDEASNAIIIVGSDENIEKMAGYVKNLDQKEQFGGAQHTTVVALKNAEADNVVKILNDVFSKKFYPKDAPRPIFSVDPHLNSVIAVSSIDELAEIKDIVNALDKERQQVFVKARIIEISDTKASQIGVKYGAEGFRVDSKGLYSFAANLGGPAIALSSQVTGMANVKLDNVKEGLALGASIALLNTLGAANILSEPSLLCINNQESSIYVGKTESIISSSTVGATTTDLTKNTYSRQDIGLSLKIKPRLSTDNKVTLYVETKLEDILPNSTAGMPTTTKREVKTTAIVNNGESVIIGGLIKDSDSNSQNKVPGASDIPLLGEAFKYTENSKEKINLVIILTPYIVDKSSDLSTLRRKLQELDKIQDEYTKRILVEKTTEKPKDK
jgi:general secretion pathway protein D